VRTLGWALAALVALVVPLLLPNPYYLHVIGGAYITGIAVYALNVIVGFGGLLNLGNAAFFGIGAYGVALLEMKAGWPFWPALLAGCAMSAGLGALVGMISLRTRGNYFAILTAAIGVIIYVVFSKWQDLTNGDIGIVSIPPATLGSFALSSNVSKYYFALAALAVAILVTTAVRYSLFGRSLIGIADNENLARAAGIDATRVKLIAFVTSTSLAGFAGGISAAFMGTLGPNATGIDLTFEQLLYLVVGGIGTLAGPLIGTLLLTGLTQWLQFLEQYRFLVFGPLLVVLVLFFPHGIAGAYARLTARGRERRAQPVAAATEIAAP